MIVIILAFTKYKQFSGGFKPLEITFSLLFSILIATTNLLDLKPSNQSHPKFKSLFVEHVVYKHIGKGKLIAFEDAVSKSHQTQTYLLNKPILYILDGKEEMEATSSS